MNKDIIKDLKIIKSKAEFDKLLALFHFVNINELRTIPISGIPKRYKLRIIFKEIYDEFEQSYTLIDNHKNLIAISVLRNAFEEMMLFMSVFLDDGLTVDIKHNPIFFRKKVMDRAASLFKDIFSADDIDKTYGHLCNLLHPNTIKLCISYLNTRKEYSDFIGTELKTICIIMECMLLMFFNSVGLYQQDAYQETLAITSEIEIVNALMLLLKFKGNHGKKVKYLFRTEKAQTYLNTQKTQFEADIEQLKQDNNAINEKIKEMSRTLGAKLIKMGYEDNLNAILK